MELTLILVTTIYAALFGWFWYIWPRPKTRIMAEDNPKPPVKVTVLIPVRDEEQGILALLQDLAAQTYPCQHFEVIVLDDNSLDSTCDIVQAYQPEAPYQLRLLPAAASGQLVESPKKRAITRGVEAATGDWILCTDGDCRVPQSWINSYRSIFGRPEISFVSGPVRMEAGNSWWSQFQSLEFASLIGVGAITIEQGYPSMCNGASMAFRSRSFEEVNGYQGYEEIVSGDDQILMAKMNARYSNSIAFNFDSKSVVTTGTSKKFTEFIQQRIRWAGKWRYHPGFNLTALGIFIFGFYLLFSISIVWILAFRENIALLAATVMVKILVDYLFLSRVTIALGQSIPLGTFLLSELIYPFYALFFGAYSQFGRFNWKNRKFNHKAGTSSPDTIVSDR